MENIPSSGCNQILLHAEADSIIVSVTVKCPYQKIMNQADDSQLL